MRIISLFLVVLFSFPIFSFGEEITTKEAKRVAKNYFYANATNNLSRNYESLDLELNHIESGNLGLSFYVFNINNSDGFIITSAQDFTKPILAYSDQNNIDFSNLSPSLKFMLDGYKKQIQYGIDQKAKANNRISRLWQELQIPNQNRTSVTDAVGPLLLTTWNQAPYYNDQCPLVTNSEGEQVLPPVGCVAVAMAQVMKYYNYPESGMNSYSWKGDDIDYSQETYEWANMPNNLNNENEDLAKLMYHSAHTLRMNWTATGSGTQSSYIPYALKHYFGYQDSEEFDRQSWNGGYYYTDAEWEKMIRDELDLLRPIVYSGFSSSGGAGHAWNCDGYKENTDGDGYLFHMNYGWGGYGNGYFTLDNLIAEVVPGGDDELFDVGHQIILGMYPANNYPEHCVDTRTITGFQGSFGDGSNNELYQNNLNCKTIVKPECATGKVILTFNRFDLAEGDELYLYKGTTVNDPVLAVLSSSNPPSGQYISYNDGILMRFVTNGSEQSQGWDAQYLAYVCGGGTHTELSGVITDGSGICDYQPGENCYTFIEPNGASKITLKMNSFDLDADHDYLKIYDGETDELLETWKGSNPPPALYAVNTSKVKIRFKSYSSETEVGEGWSMEYFADDVGIDELLNFNSLVKIYPNPFNSEAYIEIKNTDSKEVSLVLTDLVGRVIAEKRFDKITGVKTISLLELSDTKFNSGIYLLNVRIGNQTKTYKLISE